MPIYPAVVAVVLLRCHHDPLIVPHNCRLNGPRIHVQQVPEPGVAPSVSQLLCLEPMRGGSGMIIW